MPHCQAAAQTATTGRAAARGPIHSSSAQPTPRCRGLVTSTTRAAATSGVATWFSDSPVVAVPTNDPCSLKTSSCAESLWTAAGVKGATTSTSSADATGWYYDAVQQQGRLYGPATLLVTMASHPGPTNGDTAPTSTYQLLQRYRRSGRFGIDAAPAAEARRATLASLRRGSTPPGHLSCASSTS